MTAPHRFYVESALGDVTVVRSTATGAVTATLPIPYRDAGPPVVAAGPDGSTITALVLKGGVVGSKQLSGIYPEDMSVAQISASTGRQLSVLYRRRLGDTGEINGSPDPLALSTDATGRNLMLSIGVCNLHCTNGRNGWIHDGKLIPLQPVDGSLASETW